MELSFYKKNNKVLYFPEFVETETNIKFAQAHTMEKHQ
jgi:hypothetical protein